MKGCDMDRCVSLAVLALALGFPVLALAQGREAVVLTLPPDSGPDVARAVSDSGVTLGELVEDRQFLGSVPEGGLEAVRRALPPGVRVEPLSPEQKLQTLEPASGDAPDPAGAVAVEILPAAGASDAAVAEALRALPVEVLDANQQQGWVLKLDPADLGRLAQEPIVESIYSAPSPEELQ